MSFLSTKNGSTLLRIKATTNSAKSAIAEKFLDEKDKEYLKINVTESPENGKANTAIIKLLSKFLKIPKSELQILKGLTSRVKTIAISRIVKLEEFNLDKI